MSVPRYCEAPNTVSQTTDFVSTSTYQARMIVSISNAHEVSRSAGHWKRKLRVANGASIAKRATPETGASGELSGGREVSVRRSSIVHKVAANATLPDRAGQASINTAWAPCRRDAAMQRAESMVRKSGYRFLEKTMLKRKKPYAARPS